MLMVTSMISGSSTACCPAQHSYIPKYKHKCNGLLIEMFDLKFTGQQWKTKMFPSSVPPF